jgi:hypothetical protein
MASPVAQLQHLELTEEFYKAFRDLPEKGPSGIPVNWPRYFALCHATELALKAFLLAHGWFDRQTRSPVFRHFQPYVGSDPAWIEYQPGGAQIIAGNRRDQSLL